MLGVRLNPEDVGIGGSSTNAAPPRLVKAAHEFEAMMLKEILKPLTNTNALTGDDEEDSAGSNEAIQEFGSESLGRALSERGGMGIATAILRSFSHKETTSRNTTVTGT